MKLYKLYQDIATSYDSYDSAVVCAEDQIEATKIHPRGIECKNDIKATIVKWSDWCNQKDVKVEYLGEAKEGLKRGVIVASFNAG
jgi:hypothetical protein